MSPTLPKPGTSALNRAPFSRNPISPRAAVAFSALDLLRQLRSTLQRWLSTRRTPRVPSTARSTNRHALSDAIVDKHRPWIRVYLPHNDGEVGVAELH